MEFEGGLVAGSIHVEQFAPLLLHRFGETWLHQDVLSVYFRYAIRSSQPAWAILLPDDTLTGASPLRMEDEAGRLVCEGAAFRRRPDVLTPLRPLLAERVISPAGSLLSRVKAGRTVRGIVSVNSNSRLARDLPGIIAPLEAYGAVVLPADLAVDALRAVEPALALVPPHATGRNGRVELELINGPIWPDTPYTCNAEILSLGRTPPRAERLWHQSDLCKDTVHVARLLMLSRFL